MSSTPPPCNLDELVRVPIGNGSDRWRTVQFQRTVLMVVRTATTFVRLVQIAEHLFCDPRIQIVFTICDGRSAFARGLEAAIVERGCVYVPWSQARESQFDLAISASLNGPLSEIDAPLLLIDHGPGHTKNQSIPREEDEAWQALVHARRRCVLAFTNEDERALFPSSFETRVIGDPMLDAILSARKLREVYRSQLGAEGRKLVVLTSTWGRESSFSKSPELACELLRRLPSSDYAIASILHPNIWLGHGPWQVRVWYRDALDAGLTLVPFDDAWQAVIVAADCVLGDHGSVALYALMAGIPLARLSYDHSDMKSTMSMVSSLEDAPLVDSIDEIIRFVTTEHPVSTRQVEERLARSFSHVGSAAGRFFSLVYEMLELPESETLKTPYALELNLSPTPPNSHYVSIRQRHDINRIALYAAAVGRGERTRHAPLVVRSTETNFRILQSCQAVVCDGTHLACWKSLCPNARYALAVEDGTMSLLIRGESPLTVRSELTDLIATCAAAMLLHEQGSLSGVFSCGPERGVVALCR